MSIFVAYFLAKYVATFLNSTFQLSSYFEKMLTKWGVGESGLVGVSREKMGSVITFVLSIIAVWILLKLVIWLLAKLFSSVTNNSSEVSGLNRLLGFLFGTAQALVIIVVVFGLLAIVSTFLGDSTQTKINDFMKGNPVSYKVYTYVAEWTGDHLKDQIDKALDKITGDTSSVEDDNTNSSELTTQVVTLTSESDVVGVQEIVIK